MNQQHHQQAAHAAADFDREILDVTDLPFFIKPVTTLLNYTITLYVTAASNLPTFTFNASSNNHLYNHNHDRELLDVTELPFIIKPLTSLLNYTIHLYTNVGIFGSSSSSSSSSFEPDYKNDTCYSMCNQNTNVTNSR